MSNIDILRQGIEDFGIEASDKMLADFQKYKDILVEWNQKMNLTGIEDEKEVFIKQIELANKYKIINNNIIFILINVII